MREVISLKKITGMYVNKMLKKDYIIDYTNI